MITQYEEKGKIFTTKVTKNQREVLIQTTTNKIRGFIHVQIDLRLLDELNESNHFFALTDVEILDVNEKVIYKSNFLAINTDQIIWILPSDEIIEKL
jgi:hypothetical protein